MYELADMHRDGRSIPENIETALARYRQAATQDDDESIADRARSRVETIEQRKAVAAAAPPESRTPP
jgi:hypothetical protein